MNITPNRSVALLTPILFAPLAGAISVLVARYMPGVDIDKGSLEAIFITGATIAFAKAGLWLKGWQDYEKRHHLVSGGAPAAADALPGPEVDDDLGDDLDGGLDQDLDLDADVDDDDGLDAHDDFDLDADLDNDDLLADGEPLAPGQKG